MTISALGLEKNATTEQQGDQVKLHERRGRAAGWALGSQEGVEGDAFLLYWSEQHKGGRN